MKRTTRRPYERRVRSDEEDLGPADPLEQDLKYHDCLNCRTPVGEAGKWLCPRCRSRATYLYTPQLEGC